jgi:hypothetical protein
VVGLLTLAWATGGSEGRSGVAPAGERPKTAVMMASTKFGGDLIDFGAHIACN